MNSGPPLGKLQKLIEENQTWLVKRVLDYAKKRDFVKYTSPLVEAWRIAITGLSDTLLDAMAFFKGIPELGPDEKYASDPIAKFAVIEAQRHRRRGVTLSMFLGLMKYYRQSYIDLIAESSFTAQEKLACRLFIVRCFDRIEIGFCTEWTGITEIQKVVELQITNRLMMNEKNKYLTIFESLHSPAILLKSENLIENVNHAAAQLIENSYVTGKNYFHVNTNISLPWLHKEINNFFHSDSIESSFEKVLSTNKGLRYFNIKLKKMLDVTNKFNGAVIIFDDITERKKMDDKLQLMATTDSLTGIYNRGWYLELTKREILRSRRYGLPLSLIMADIDHFKRINDTFGHQVGDEVLRNVSSVFHEQLRAVDITGRLGGEEFGITLIESDLKKAVSTADRLRDRITKCRVQTVTSDVHFTISIGVAQYEEQDNTIQSFMKRADKALYRAKHNGRNCIQIAG